MATTRGPTGALDGTLESGAGKTTLRKLTITPTKPETTVDDGEKTRDVAPPPGL